MANPVSRQPAGAAELYPFSGQWQNKLFDSCKPCSRFAYACFCGPCFTAQLTDRVGDHILTCCVNPSTLMTIRTKVRTAYKIEGSLIEDCLTTTCCCAAPCAALQIEKELDHRGVPAKRAK